MQNILDTDQKALEINLDSTIYGTFAEIGAGQEVARHFFKVGAAVGTIAKTMSAYDKIYSDQIYGQEKSGRYVCESRLYKMLDHEYGLMVERLEDHLPDTKFFVFADTVAAINYARTIKGNGWLGVRFQLSPDGPPNDVAIHVRMHDNDNGLQQQAIGILGVNLIYACYNFSHDMEGFVSSLIDGIQGRVTVDMIRIKGGDFKDVDNRLLTYYLVKNDLSEIAMFDENGDSIHAGEFLYRHSVMVVRGNYRPPTLTSVNVFESSFKQFKDDFECDEEKSTLLAELSLNNLKIDGEINLTDFLNRAKLLNKLGHKVIISNYPNHHNLISYLREFKVPKLGLLIGVNELQTIINEKYERNHDGRLLSAMGELFTKNIRIYAFPALNQETNELITASNLPVPEGIDFLIKYLLDSQHIVEVQGYDPELLSIFAWEVLDSINRNDDEWKKMVPAETIQLIEKEQMFVHSINAVNIEN